MILGLAFIVNKLTNLNYKCLCLVSSGTLDSEEAGEREGRSSTTLTSALPPTLSTVYISRQLNPFPDNAADGQMAMKIAEQNIPTDMSESRTRPVLCPVSVNLQSAATRDGGYFPGIDPCSD